MVASNSQAGRRPITSFSAERTRLQEKEQLIQWLQQQNYDLQQRVMDREKQLQVMQFEVSQARQKELALRREIEQVQTQGSADADQRVEDLKNLLRTAMEQLEEATRRNEALVMALDESQAEIAKLKTRMDEVERERDNLVDIVEGSGSGGKALKELMDRNRELMDQLDRAEQLAASLSELNQEKDADIQFLRREIAAVGQERDRLMDQNLRHQQNIDELARKLEMLSNGLTAEERASLQAASPLERQENELLRAMVLKQLRRQAQVKQAKELLLGQLDQLGERSETLLSLVDDMARGSQITAEEKALFRSPQFQEILDAAAGSEVSQSGSVSLAGSGQVAGADLSGTLVYAAPRGNVPATQPNATATVSLEQQLAQIDEKARADFSQGRLEEAEIGFLEYLKHRPEDLDSLCNLGVLKTATSQLDDAAYYLEKAIAVSDESSRAHFLLGRVLYMKGDLDEALVKLEACLSLDPDNAHAHNSLGVVSSQKGWVDRAEEAFQQAVSLDPDYGDAHFNLAILYAMKESVDPNSVRRHYSRALELGVDPDPSLEAFLEKNGPVVGLLSE